uniref:STAS domain-containing protein n=1 Tax=Megaselia scalaris TaxID=36166 RepID=T1GRJ6_MEGSC
SAEYLKEKIISFIEKHDNVHVVIIDGIEIFSVDSTVALNFVMLKNDMESNGCEILFWNWEVKAAGVICRWEP